MGRYYSDLVLSESSLQSYWKCNEASGNLADSKGSVTATANGSPSYSQTGYSTLLGSAVKGDGSTAYFDCGDNYMFTSGSFTCEYWGYRGTGNKNRMVSKYEESTSGGWHLGWDGGTSGTSLHIYSQRWYSGAATTDVVGTTVISNSTWYHVAFTWNGTAGKLYLNGVEDKSVNLSNGNLSNHGKPLKILATTSGNSTTFYNDSTIQHIAIYNAALSAATLLSHYNAAKADLAKLNRVSQAVQRAATR